VLGRGSTNWDHLFAALRDADYVGPLTIDPLDLPDPQAAAVDSLKFLRARLRA
jgi:sugar phosphate isomerase/epimerase